MEPEARTTRIATLRSAMLSDFEGEPVVLLTPRDEEISAHGIAATYLAAALRGIALVPRFTCKDGSVALDHHGLILVGNLFDFCADAGRFARRAGYPARIELMQSPAGLVMCDHKAAGDGAIGEPGAHIGLAYRASDSDIFGRETLLLFGTSVRAIIGAAIWASQESHAAVPAPPTWPQYPIEAVIEVQHAAELVPSLSDLETRLLLCGPLEFSKKLHDWKSAAARTHVTLILIDGEPRYIEVDTKRIKITATDLPRVLFMLAENTRKGLWTSFADIQLRLDGHRDLSRVHSLENRRKDIRLLSPDPLFLESDIHDGAHVYRLRADVGVKACRSSNP